VLFTELALIRWAGANVLYLSYFSNFVLLGSFLGIGIGFLRARATFDAFRLAPLALAGLVAFVIAFPVQIDRSGTDVIYFGSYGRTGLPAWVTLPVIFVAVAAAMATIAEGVGRTFARFPPLEAYRLDIVGSLAGILAFSVLAFLGAPPFAWGLAIAIALLVAYGRPSVWQAVGLAVMLALLGIQSLAPMTSWSPYYEIETLDEGGGRVIVSVNGVPHQVIESLDLRRELEPIYFRPYELLTSHPRSVLVVGAGTGGDVAIALEEQAGSVVAVEIDPRLADLGRDLNPDRPYQDPRVRMVVDDGRAFLERTDERFDLILFALPDSLTLVSGQSSLRLESYLFTLQAIETARERLTEGGVFAMYNYYRERWLIDRFGRTLEDAFGHRPCIDEVGDQGRFALLTIGLERDSVECRRTWAPTANPVPTSATDDHPFPYLREPGVPTFYLAAIAFILVASLVLVRLAAGPFSRMRGYLDLFFMGAAFLLLETKNVIQFALLFGTTWFVNALVFTGVLLSVLAAIEAAQHLRLPSRRALYLVLFLALTVAWVVPGEALLALAPVPRFVTAVVIAFTPIFAANLVFAERFRSVSASAVAFGTNLLGAMVGGLLEYASLLVGYRSLLLVAGALYALAFVAGRTETAPSPVPPRLAAPAA
jgi:SAM-dependent methyltransferase